MTYISTIIFALAAIAFIGSAISGIVWSKQNDQDRKLPIALFFLLAAACAALAIHNFQQVI